MTLIQRFVSQVLVPQKHDQRSNLTVPSLKVIWLFLEQFRLARVYNFYNVPMDTERGGDAHQELEQVVFDLSGSFRVKIDDGAKKSEYWLRGLRKGFYTSKLVWREMDCFSQGAVCMVIV